MNEQLVPLIVTTEYKGVFFGYGKVLKSNTSITLKNARMCVAWPNSTHSMAGLCSISSAEKGLKISPRVPSVILYRITGVFEPTPKAVAVMETEPWS
jgi:hypothetical protein